MNDKIIPSNAQSGNTSQLSLFSNGDEPLPIRIAHQFGFPLSSVQTDKGLMYSVQDWIVGVSQSKQPAKLWTAAKHDNPDLSTSSRQLPYQAKDGKTYQTDHADAYTLYRITGTLIVNRSARWSRGEQ